MGDGEIFFSHYLFDNLTYEKKILFAVFNMCARHSKSTGLKIK